MVDRELARLAALPADIPLDGLEQALWPRIEAAAGWRRTARVMSRTQMAALGAGVIASTLVGAALAQPRSREAAPISSVVAELAPSSLLGPAR